MKFSAIVLNYASWPLTRRCVASLREAGGQGLEIIVVDNDTQAVPELPSDVRLLRTGRNLGFARAVNRGLAAASGETVVLVNPDSVVEATFFGQMEKFLDEHPSVGIVGPKILDSDGKVQLSARREVTVISGLLGRTSFLTRLFPKSSLVKSQFPAAVGSDTPTPVDWVSGACMAIRRETLDRIGTLDERFFMYFEDADLCRRAREAGLSVYYVPHITVVHHAGGSTRSRPRAVWRLHKSAFLYHRKHGKHGPLGLYSALVLVGLTGRALLKLVVG
jgi:N-acetylglucosaminyl-diphospho-decaprenol L-rhamnosyltransferase